MTTITIPNNTYRRGDLIIDPMKFCMYQGCQAMIEEVNRENRTCIITYVRCPHMYFYNIEVSMDDLYPNYEPVDPIMFLARRYYMIHNEIENFFIRSMYR